MEELTKRRPSMEEYTSRRRSSRIMLSEGIPTELKLSPSPSSFPTSSPLFDFSLTPSPTSSETGGIRSPPLSKSNLLISKNVKAGKHVDTSDNGSIDDNVFEKENTNDVENLKRFSELIISPMPSRQASIESPLHDDIPQSSLPSSSTSSLSSSSLALSAWHNRGLPVYSTSSTSMSDIPSSPSENKSKPEKKFEDNGCKKSSLSNGISKEKIAESSKPGKKSKFMSRFAMRHFMSSDGGRKPLKDKETVGVDGDISKYSIVENSPLDARPLIKALDQTKDNQTPDIRNERNESETNSKQLCDDSNISNGSTLPHNSKDDCEKNYVPLERTSKNISHTLSNKMGGQQVSSGTTLADTISSALTTPQSRSNKITDKERSNNSENNTNGVNKSDSSETMGSYDISSRRVVTKSNDEHFYKTSSNQPREEMNGRFQSPIPEKNSIEMTQIDNVIHPHEAKHLPKDNMYDFINKSDSTIPIPLSTSPKQKTAEPVKCPPIVESHYSLSRRKSHQFLSDGISLDLSPLTTPSDENDGEDVSGKDNIGSSRHSDTRSSVTIGSPEMSHYNSIDVVDEPIIEEEFIYKARATVRLITPISDFVNARLHKENDKKCIKHGSDQNFNENVNESSSPLLNSDKTTVNYDGVMVNGNTKSVGDDSEGLGMTLNGHNADGISDNTFRTSSVEGDKDIGLPNKTEISSTSGSELKESPMGLHLQTTSSESRDQHNIRSRIRQLNYKGDNNMGKTHKTEGLKGIPSIHSDQTRTSLLNRSADDLDQHDSDKNGTGWDQDDDNDKLGDLLKQLTLTSDPLERCRIRNSIRQIRQEADSERLKKYPVSRGNLLPARHTQDGYDYFPNRNSPHLTDQPSSVSTKRLLESSGLRAAVDNPPTQGGSGSSSLVDNAINRSSSLERSGSTNGGKLNTLISNVNNNSPANFELSKSNTSDKHSSNTRDRLDSDTNNNKNNDEDDVFASSSSDSSNIHAINKANNIINNNGYRSLESDTSKINNRPSSASDISSSYQVLQQAKARLRSRTHVLLSESGVREPNLNLSSSLGETKDSRTVRERHKVPVSRGETETASDRYRELRRCILGETSPAEVKLSPATDRRLDKYSDNYFKPIEPNLATSARSVEPSGDDISSKSNHKAPAVSALVPGYNFSSESAANEAKPPSPGLVRHQAFKVPGHLKDKTTVATDIKNQEPSICNTILDTPVKSTTSSDPLESNLYTKLPPSSSATITDKDKIVSFNSSLTNTAHRLSQNKPSSDNDHFQFQTIQEDKRSSPGQSRIPVKISNDRSVNSKSVEDSKFKNRKENLWQPEKPIVGSLVEKFSEFREELDLEETKLKTFSLRRTGSLNSGLRKPTVPKPKHSIGFIDTDSLQSESKVNRVTREWNYQDSRHKPQIIQPTKVFNKTVSSNSFFEPKSTLTKETPTQPLHTNVPIDESTIFQNEYVSKSESTRTENQVPRVNLKTDTEACENSEVVNDTDKEQNLFSQSETTLITNLATHPFENKEQGSTELPKKFDVTPKRQRKIGIVHIGSLPPTVQEESALELPIISESNTKISTIYAGGTNVDSKEELSQQRNDSKTILPEDDVISVSKATLLNNIPSQSVKTKVDKSSSTRIKRFSVPAFGLHGSKNPDFGSGLETKPSKLYSFATSSPLTSPVPTRRQSEIHNRKPAATMEEAFSNLLDDLDHFGGPEDTGSSSSDLDFSDSDSETKTSSDTKQDNRPTPTEHELVLTNDNNNILNDWDDSKSCHKNIYQNDNNAFQTTGKSKVTSPDALDGPNDNEKVDYKHTQNKDDKKKDKDSRSQSVSKQIRPFGSKISKSNKDAKESNKNQNEDAMASTSPRTKVMTSLDSWPKEDSGIGLGLDETVMALTKDDVKSRTASSSPLLHAYSPTPSSTSTSSSSSPSPSSVHHQQIITSTSIPTQQLPPQPSSRQTSEKDTCKLKQVKHDSDSHASQNDDVVSNESLNRPSESIEKNEIKPQTMDQILIMPKQELDSSLTSGKTSNTSKEDNENDNNVNNNSIDNKTITSRVNNINNSTNDNNNYGTRTFDVNEEADGTYTVRAAAKDSTQNRVVTVRTKKQRTPSNANEELKDTIVERKIFSRSGSVVGEERDVIQTKKRLTHRGSQYYQRNAVTTKTLRNQDGEIVEHDVSVEYDNTSVSQGQSWADKVTTKVVVGDNAPEVKRQSDGIDLATSGSSGYGTTNEESDTKNNEDKDASTTCSTLSTPSAEYLFMEESQKDVFYPDPFYDNTEKKSMVSLQCTDNARDFDKEKSNHDSVVSYINSRNANAGCTDDSVGITEGTRKSNENGPLCKGMNSRRNSRRHSNKNGSETNRTESEYCTSDDYDDEDYYDETDDDDVDDTVDAMSASGHSGSLRYGMSGSNVRQSVRFQKSFLFLGSRVSPPEIVQALKDVTVTEGKPIVLECRILAKPEPTITWYKDDESVEDGDDYVIRFDPEMGKANLLIGCSTLFDTAKYTCQGQNTAGNAKTQCRALVKRRPTKPPIFERELVDVVVTEGHSSMLVCSVKEATSVSWYKDGIVQRNSSDFKQTFDGATARLEIGEVFLDDVGTYTCVAKNDVGEEKTSCKLNVNACTSETTVVPMFLTKLTNPVVNDGERLELECDVIGSPEPSISWMKQGEPLDSGDLSFSTSYDGRVARLVVDGMKSDDAGRYTCVAHNPAGRVSMDSNVTVQVKNKAPYFTDALAQEMTAKSGEVVVLKCEISGSPPPVILWRKNGILIGSGTNVIQSYNGRVARLEILGVTSQDGGIYECVGKNSVSEVTCSCVLTVTGSNATTPTSPPTIQSDQSTPLPQISRRTFKKLSETRPKDVITAVLLRASLSPTGGLQRAQSYSPGSSTLSPTSPSSPTPSTNNDIPLPSRVPNTSTFSLPKSPSSAVPSTQTDQSPSAVSSAKETSNNDVTTVPQRPETLQITRNSITISPKSRQNSLDNSKSSVKDNFITSTQTKTSPSPQSSSPSLSSSSSTSSSPRSHQVVRSASMHVLRNKFSHQEPAAISTPPQPSKPLQITLSSSSTAPESKTKSREETGTKTESSQNNTHLSPSNNSIPGYRSVSPSFLNSPSRDKQSPSPLTTKTEEKGDQRATVPDAVETTPSIGSNYSTSPNSLQQAPKKTPSSEYKSSNDSSSSRSLSSSSSSSSSLTSSSSTNIKSNNSDDVCSKSSRSPSEQPLQQEQEPTSKMSRGRMVSPRVSELRQQFLKNDQNASSGSSKPSSGGSIRRWHSLPPQEARPKLIKAIEMEVVYHSHPQRDNPTVPSPKTETVRQTATMPNYDQINDEEELHGLMNKTDDFDERKKIRARLREIRDKQREEMEARRKARDTGSQDAVKLKFQMQEDQKKLQMEGFAKQAVKTSTVTETKTGASGETKTSTTTTTESSKSLPGGGTRTVIQKKTETTVQSKGLGTSYGKPAEQTARELTEQLMRSTSAGGGTAGHITVKTESWNSNDGMVNRSQKTQSWGGGGGGGGTATPSNPMDAFKKMDNAANPSPAKPNGLLAVSLAKRAANNMRRNAVAIKQEILYFCQMNTQEYENVQITNFSSSWNTGMAFCALIHHFYPDAFDFAALNPKARRFNFTLAFDTAEQKADIAPLLDVDDMVKMKNPDWKCVFTYVQSLYRHLRDHENNKVMPCPVATAEQ